MRKNVNFSIEPSFVPRFDDGSVIVCQVDQFPVEDPSLFKDNGYPRSDIGIIDRLSTLGIDSDHIQKIANRIVDMSAQSPYQGLTDDEMLRVLRPAYVQTASEYKYYSEQVYQFMSERQAKQSTNLVDSEETTTTEEPKSD